MTATSDRESHLTRWCAYNLRAYRFAAQNVGADSPNFIYDFLKFNPRIASTLGRYEHSVLAAEFARLDASVPASLAA